MKIVVLVLSILLGLAFLMAGGSKLAAAEMHVSNFEKWGYPGWFMYVTGALEILAAVMIMLPKTRFYGAALLVCTMVGAVLTHMAAGETDMVVPPVVLLGLALFVALKHRSLTAA